MRIAQVAPLYESVPPARYGGTERVVYYLTEELIRQGHEVTLFATSDSKTSARLVPSAPTALRLMPECREPTAYHLYMLEKVYRQSHRFDIIHFHCDYLHFPISRREVVPHVTTLHGRLDLPELDPLFLEFTEVPLVSISDSQRRPLPFAYWIDTVYHGLPRGLYRFSENPADYLAFLGRVSPEKGLEDAIRIALRAGMKLRIAAKIDDKDRRYFDEVLVPLIREHQGQLEFLGEIGDDQKEEFLGGARALLFPINWPEPFGLVMIESMMCGTPVIAYPAGSVPEILENRRTGFVVHGLEEAVQAVRAIENINRRKCFEICSERFSVSRMTNGYLRAYERVIREKRKIHPA